MSAPKLTKKQKKSLAFRERKSIKQKGKNASESQATDGFHDLPEAEDADWYDEEGDEHVVEEQAETKGKERESDKQEKGGKKRKRQDVEESNEEEPQPIKKKKKSKDSVQRFILFIGNLKYTTTKEAIAAHFAECGDPPPSIRLLQPKAKPGSVKTTSKSKGCAFLEFTEKTSLQKALKLHQSELEGRKINVELTAGGGGNSEARISKLKERNKTLFGQRKNRLEKAAAKDKDNNTDPTNSLQRPQRYSATSGVALAPQKKRTWSIAEMDDDGVHRGGRKHTKKGKSKSWGTGANATPVG